MDRPFDVVLDTLIRINQDYAAAFARRCARRPNITKHFFQDGIVYQLGDIPGYKKFPLKGFIIVGDEIYICTQEEDDDAWYQTYEGIMI